MSKARRVARAIKHQKHKDEMRNRAGARRPPRGPCPRCGEEGPHFVPPCFGDRGFFICESREAAACGEPLDIRNYARWPIGSLPWDEVS